MIENSGISPKGRRKWSRRITSPPNHYRSLCHLLYLLIYLLPYLFIWASHALHILSHLFLSALLIYVTSFLHARHICILNLILWKLYLLLYYEPKYSLVISFDLGLIVSTSACEPNFIYSLFELYLMFLTCCMLWSSSFLRNFDYSTLPFIYPLRNSSWIYSLGFFLLKCYNIFEKLEKSIHPL